MKCKNILFIGLVGCFVSIQPIHGQFVTKRLASLAKTTGVVLSDSLKAIKPLDIDSAYHFRNHPLHIKTDNEGAICHIGYSLFGSRIRQANPSVVYDFIERYMLELDLAGSKQQIESRLKQDNVICKGNPKMMIASDNKDEVLMIDNRTCHKYLVQWQRGDNYLTLEFNADCQLITGANDKELEDILTNKIKRISQGRYCENDYLLIVDRYGYAKDSVRFCRQDIVSLLEEECDGSFLHYKNNHEDVFFSINRDLGYVHLVNFKLTEARLVPYIPIYDAPDSFIHQIVPTMKENDDGADNGNKLVQFVLEKIIQNIQKTN